MSHHDDPVAAVLQQRLVAIIRADSAHRAVLAGNALLSAGVAALEVSLTTPDALRAIAELAAQRPAGTYVGAGTVLSTRQVVTAADAGAAFIVSPTTRVDVIRQAHDRGLASIPAASTPNEMVQARDAGADLVKVFPASAWTPRALRDVLVALPDLRLVPTGGIALADAAEWIRAGAAAVGLGGSLTAGSAQTVTEQARRVLAELAGAADNTAVVAESRTGAHAGQ